MKFNVGDEVVAQVSDKAGPEITKGCHYTITKIEYNSFYDGYDYWINTDDEKLFDEIEFHSFFLKVDQQDVSKINE